MEYAFEEVAGYLRRNSSSRSTNFYLHVWKRTSLFGWKENAKRPLQIYGHRPDRTFELALQTLELMNQLLQPFLTWMVGEWLVFLFFHYT